MTLETSFSFKGKLLVTSNVQFNSEREYGVGAVLVGNECLVFGGYSGGGMKHRIHKYNHVKKEWKSTLPENEYNRFGSVRLAFIVDDTLYAYVWHGAGNAHVFMSINLISMDEWVPTGRANCPQLGFGISGSFIESRNEAIMFGGKNQNPVVFVYNVHRSAWYSPKVSGRPPVSRESHATCSIGQRMFVIGGRLVRVRLDAGLDLHILTMSGKRFSWSTPLTTGRRPKGRFNLSATCVPGRIIMYGGYPGDVTRLIIYSTTEHRWYRGRESSAPNEKEGIIHFTSELNNGNSHHAAARVGDKLLVFGGFRMSSANVLEISAT